MAIEMLFSRTFLGMKHEANPIIATKKYNNVQWRYWNITYKMALCYSRKNPSLLRDVS